VLILPKAISDSAGRRFNTLDRLIDRVDGAIRALAPPNRVPTRPSPAAAVPENPLEPAERRHSAGLMRVNHTGEVCAQALYLGQAMVARDPALTAALTDAAAEERDHLVWCAERLAELHSHPSMLNPVWFTGSVAIAVATAAAGDAVSLGFVEETERQVCAHLDGHLERLSERDERSRAIVQAMRADEARHADNAHAAGARTLPPLARRIMALQARVMTTLAYWF
jgi:ubiquinone biosynthesis monooxygenase Coq7